MKTARDPDFRVLSKKRVNWHFKKTF